MNQIQEQIKELKRLTEIELDFCNIEDTPYLCAAISFPTNKVKITDQIATIVINRGVSISNAIFEVEQELNPQITS